MMDFHHENISTAMSFDELLRVLYPKQDKYRLAAAWLIKAAAEKDGLDGYELSKICDEKSISRATMQKVFVRLRRLGMVERRSMRYYVNAEFSTATRRLSEAWRNMTKEKRFSFEDSSLKVNL
jgi:predicted transcriptional regulator